MAQHGDFGDTSVTVCSLSGRVGGLHYFPSFFSISSTCQVGHLDLEILLSHISSNFCDVFCWTLQCYRDSLLKNNLLPPLYFQVLKDREQDVSAKTFWQKKSSRRFGKFFMPKRPVLSWFCFWFSTNWT